jgi:hypothetical protein
VIGSIAALGMYVFDLLSPYSDNSWPNYLIFGGLSGIHLGFIFPWYNRRAIKRQIDKIQPRLQAHEEVRNRFAARWIQMRANVNGVLLVTNQSLHFEPYVVKVHQEPSRIPLEDIIKVEKSNSLLLWGKGLIIKTKQGKEFTFIILERKELINWVH